MADTLKRMVGPIHLTTSAATYYTVPAATVATIRAIHLLNHTGGNVTVSMSIGADSTGTRLLSSEPISGNSTFDWTGTLVMAAGEILQIFASATNSITAVVSGVESA